MADINANRLDSFRFSRKKNSVRIGKMYQADIPPMILQKRLKSERKNLKELGLKLWSAEACTKTDDILKLYVSYAKDNYQYSEDQALGLWYANGFDIFRTQNDLCKFCPDEIAWTDEEVNLFREIHEEVMDFDGRKDLNAIKQFFPEKDMGCIMKFYYSEFYARYRPLKNLRHAINNNSMSPNLKHRGP